MLYYIYKFYDKDEYLSYKNFLISLTTSSGGTS